MVDLKFFFKVENYEKMERKQSSSSCSPSSPNCNDIKTKNFSSSPFLVSASPTTPLGIDISMQMNRRIKRVSSCLKTAEFTTIMENPDDGEGILVKRYSSTNFIILL